ncbi:class I SAM-dependent methyltransferase [Streptomyces purpurogeneiscleroticus]|uniref:class I SAM-dependent methyltransferase n=1 Tax=Streptomyces purpurogeneiscleroticus TaxID=68259 RepID=UPI001CBFD5E0|nr:class I SAM-dependent methyltransferase [Streptomyces purpurogeneiscleroticus]MBZ4015945.1 methyltransferase [Streptomyces purpurogeneiscleroticus]
MGLETATAGRWVARWERQQQRYAIDREERFTVIADVVEHVLAGRDRPLVADLGCGPGSLAARLAGRLPYAAIVAVDSDPLLLELGRTHHADAARFVRATLGADGWTAALELPGPLDAAVSATALHCLSEDALRRTYEDLAALLRPGGVLVNSDMLRPDGSRTARIAQHVGRRRAERQGAPGREDWDSWWAAAARDPELAGLLAPRPVQQSAAGGHNGLTLRRHLALLRAAGFHDAGTVWQCSTDFVLVAIR